MVEQFIQYLRYERNYSSHTVLAYRKDLEQFSLFLTDEYGVDDLSRADADMIRFWLLRLMEEGLSARSVNRKLSSLKSFWRYLLAKGLAKENPCRKLLSPKVHKSLPSFLKKEEMESLLDDACENEDISEFVAKRNRLMIEMLLQTGMRRSELMGLALSDVDMSSCLL
ncbi:MAG: site-specific integrase, partial [Bacteroidales bacterium]|nr:site-specific integrase [Bacteroidales bacterium]